MQTNDFGVRLIWFREEIAIRVYQVSNFHAVAVGIFPRTKHMPVQINALFREGEYGGNLDLVDVLNLKLLKRLGHCGLTVVFRDIKPEHAPAFMSLHPTDINVAQ